LKLERRSKKMNTSTGFFVRNSSKWSLVAFFLEDTIEANRNTYGEGISKRKEREREIDN